MHDTTMFTIQWFQFLMTQLGKYLEWLPELLHKVNLIVVFTRKYCRSSQKQPLSIYPIAVSNMKFPIVKCIRFRRNIFLTNNVSQSR